MMTLPLRQCPRRLPRSIARISIGPTLSFRCMLVVAMLGMLAISPRPTIAQTLPPEFLDGADDAPAAAEPSQALIRTLAEAPTVEHQALKALLEGQSWPRRALGAMRMERYRCEDSRAILFNLMKDKSPHVRAYAIATLSRLRIDSEPSWFAEEEDPSVVRTALRCRYAIDPERLGRAVRFLCRSRSPDDQMLGMELGAASGDDELIELATQTMRRFILRMDRVAAGRFAERVALLTGAAQFRTASRWQNWLRQQGRDFTLRPGHYVPEDPAEPILPSLIATLEPEQLSNLERYIDSLAERSIDLAIAIDCTASMGNQLAQAQGGLEDLMQFMSEIVSDLRIGIVAYRDRGDEFITKGWPFSSDINEVKRNLWSLTADGGGDNPEAVYDALRVAYMQLIWLPQNVRVLMLIGDAPPHVGFGERSVHLARLAQQSGCATHVIQAGGDEVKWFPEIAEAGNGKAVLLGAHDSLIALITGLTVESAFEEEFREFFQLYLLLYRR